MQRVSAIVLPAALPSLFTGVREGLAAAWQSLVIIELFASFDGLGYLMTWGRQLFQLELVIVAMIVIAAIGLSLNAVLGYLEHFIQPWKTEARHAWVPLLSAWFGGADAGKIAFIAVAGFQPVVINTWQGVKGLPPAYRELADVLIFSRIDYVRLVALPGTLPAIFTGLHAGLIHAWLAALGSELFLNVTPGIGGRLNEGSQLFDMDLLFLGIIILAVIGLFYNSSAVWLETRLLRTRTR